MKPSKVFQTSRLSIIEMNACHEHITHSRNMEARTYLSKDVRYDIVGRQRFTTNLNVTAVSSSVNDNCKRFCGKLGFTEKVANIMTVMKNFKIKSIRKVIIDFIKNTNKRDKHLTIKK